MSQTMIAMLEEAEDVLRRAGCDMTADKVRKVLQAQQAEPVAWHTNDPCVSSEHIEAIAKVCKIIPSYTTVEYVARIVGFGHVLLADKSVQEAFVRANSHLLRTDAAQPPAVAVPLALPEWMECDAKVQAGTANALERFIAANEPAGDSAAEFRAALLAILAAAPQAAVPNEVAKDAARYRWLRQDESEFSSMTPAELDAAIDKAIAAAQKGGEA